MIKVTLDTNCIINLLDYKSKSAMSTDELTELVRYGLEGDVNIAITTRVDSDISKDKDENRKDEILKRVSIFPVIGTVARVGTTKLDGGDVWAGEEHTALQDEIRKIVFPNLKKEDPRFGNKINDIDHLIGHKINNRNIFVTDDKGILKKSDTLRSVLDLHVMDPREALEYINLQANQVVLAQEFLEKFGAYKTIVIEAITKDIKEESLAEYEDLRKWMIRKLPVISDGLLDFKFRLASVPTGGQRVFDQKDLVALQNFNDRLNGILKERYPSAVSQVASAHRHNYGIGYLSDKDRFERTVNFLNSVEDTLLGYIGTLEAR